MKVGGFLKFLLKINIDLWYNLIFNFVFGILMNDFVLFNIICNLRIKRIVIFFDFGKLVLFEINEWFVIFKKFIY